jgi:hypothetical protein
VFALSKLYCKQLNNQNSIQPFQTQPGKLMESPEDKESYLQSKAQQLHQWEQVIEKMISRDEKAKNKSNTDLRHHIVKLQVKKARTEAKLRQLQEAGNGRWDGIKTGLEKYWVELREAFKKASVE